MNVSDLEWSPWTLRNGKLHLRKNWREPMKWNRAAAKDIEEALHDFGAERYEPPRRPTVFPSLCDWLDDEVPVEWLARFLQLIHNTPNLTWLLLTKRPELWRDRIDQAAKTMRATPAQAMACNWLLGTPPPNVWVGTSVEDQTRANERIPALLRIPAAGRFLSVEPLLGPVTLDPYRLNPILTHERETARCRPHPDELVQAQVEAYQAGRIHWAIIGGESGHGARPCNVDWIRSLVRQCGDAGVPCFVKQVGAVAVEHQCGEDGAPLGNLRLVLEHPKGGDPAEWPEEIRVREFPEGLR